MLRFLMGLGRSRDRSSSRMVKAARLTKGPHIKDNSHQSLLTAAMDLPSLSLKQSMQKLMELDLYQPVASGNRKTSFTSAELHRLGEETANHAVAKLDRVDDYGNAGFCFGRAMTAHLLALRMGLDKDAVRKLWVAGNLTWREDGLRENFHVATAVRGEDGWYVIDPKFGRVQRLDQWRALLETQVSVIGQTFVTSASRFDAESAAQYDAITLRHENFGHYFQDLLKQFKAERSLQAQKQQVTSKKDSWFSW